MRLNMLRTAISLTTLVVLALTLSPAPAAKTFTAQGGGARGGAGPLQPNSLCARTERIIFSCLSKRPGSSAAKIVSLCGSRDLSKDRGYLQYRYGLPGKVELEYPGSRTGTQQVFRYTHYLRYRVDLTEINFEVDGYQYQIFDDYNGEGKRELSSAGVNVTAPGKAEAVSFVCRSKSKADFSLLDDVLEREQ